MTQEERMNAAFVLSADDNIKRFLTYIKEGFDPQLVRTIYAKRSQLLGSCRTLEEISNLMKSPQPYYDGSEFRQKYYDIPEEEAIMWSKASLKGPLNHEGTMRYLALMKSIYNVDFENKG